MKVVRMEESHKDFFISYNKADHQWAKWIAWQLELAGYSVIVQAWDFLAGSNFVLEMHKAAIEAERTIAVLSPNYLNALYTQPEWAAALVQDPTGAERKLLPVRVQACNPQGILAAISYIDLVGLENEQDTQDKLLSAIRRQRAKPKTAPPFPLTRSDVPQTGTVPPRFPGALPALWNVPYHRNMFFTGREDILERLHGTLRAHQATALTQPQAINGLGGIGKSQTAIEYIYRYYTDYQAILWAQADSPEVLIADFVKLAGLLDLPEKDETEQQRIIEAVKRWFHTHTHWLLILDNVEQVEQIEPFIPQGGGHVLLTTRASVAEPVAQSISLDKMSEEEATTFLLRRTGTVSADAVLQTAHETARHDAQQLAHLMDGLPLALDQAGAYILETHCGLAGYLALYQQHRAELLKQRGLTLGHPDPVAATWSLSFQKVRQTNPQAAQLLQFCAFLYPDTITEELLTTPISGLKPPALVNNLLELHKAIKVLGAYSLIRRHSESMMLSMHRLVQTVLRDTLPKPQQRKWSERAICVVTSLFPSGEPETWPQCELYMLHAQTCSEWIEAYTITIPEATRLMYHAATYLKARGLSREAVPFAQRFLAIHEQVLGPNHPDTAAGLNNLAMLYKSQGEYAQAEPLYQRALAIHEQVLGPNHPNTILVRNNYARSSQ
jgi:tetratricopeptide (TPR) repeat protein